jgi:hypothetical protein
MLNEKIVKIYLQRRLLFVRVVNINIPWDLKSKKPDSTAGLATL